MEVLMPHPTGEGQKTLFVTFYSFKGGVGRTLALLNTACILAGLGRRVLMIDFDLEAPGLTLFQDKQREDGLSRQQPGLVDAIDDFLEDPWSSPIGDGAPDDFFDTYVSSLDVPEGVQKGEKDGTLDLVPAGRLDDEYETLLYDLDFEEMFEEGVGRPFFERLKDLIEDSGRYDYILVDSRTGFSDEGSICTRFLGDYLLVLTGLNRQNVRGTARFLDRSNVAEREETLALVASPVPMYYEDLRSKRIEAAREHITERADLDEVRFVTQIPYHPVLALEEDPTVRSLEGTDLFRSYEEIKERLRIWAGDRPQERIQSVLDLLRNGNEEKALTVFEDVRREDPEVALEFLRRATNFLVENYPESATYLFEEGISLAEKIDELQTRQRFVFKLALSHSSLGNLEQAICRYEEAVKLNRKLDATRGEAVALFNLGIVYSVRGNLDHAISLIKQARDLFDELSSEADKADAWIALGNRYLELDKLQDAVELYERALDIHSDAGNQRGIVLSQSNLAIVYAEQGREEEAKKILNEVKQVASGLDEHTQAKFNLDKIRALSLCEPDTARNELQEAWRLIQQHGDAFERMRARVFRARLRLEVEDDAEGAAEDAQKALDFYRERDIDSRWSREAGEILETTQRRVG